MQMSNLPVKQKSKKIVLGTFYIRFRLRRHNALGKLCYYFNRMFFLVRFF